jgi:carbonic anhydrase
MLRNSTRGFRRSIAVSSLSVALCGGAIVLFHARPASVARADDAAATHEQTAGPSADQALKMLVDGNARYAGGKAEHLNQTADRRAEVAKGQKPFAVVLTCADSRVSPEVVFDAGLGDLFVVRVAGNIADDSVLGSIEYAVEHLNSPLVVVMGHERCGAVTAAIDAATTGHTPPPHLDSLVNAIRPAVESEKPDPKETLLDRVIDANVRFTAAKISQDEVVDHLIKEGKVKVVGGHYDLDSGEFKVLDGK